MEQPTREDIIFNLVTGFCRLLESNDELQAALSAVAHAFAHANGVYHEETVSVAVNIQEEAEDGPPILTAVK